MVKIMRKTRTEWIVTIDRLQVFHGTEQECKDFVASL